MKHWRNATVALATLAFAAPAAAAPTVTEFEIPTADSKPWDIVLDPDGKLWFTENAFGADKIGRVTPGNPPVIDEFAVPTGFATPLDITVGPDHQIWFNGQCNGAGGVGRINPLDPTDKECHGGFGVTGGARGIAGGSDGSIWLGDPGNHRVLRIDPATGNLRATAGDIDLGNTFTGIKNITPGPDGNAWVTEFSGQIARVTRTGSSTPFPVTATTAWDIVSGPDGNLWYTAPNGAAAVAGRMTTAGTANEFPVTSPATLTGSRLASMALSGSRRQLPTASDT